MFCTEPSKLMLFEITLQFWVANIQLTVVIQNCAESNSQAFAKQEEKSRAEAAEAKGTEWEFSIGGIGMAARTLATPGS